MLYSISPEHGTSDYFFLCMRKNSSCYPHAHSHLELIFVLEGQLSLSVDDAQCSLPADTVAILMPYQIHRYQPETDTTTFHIACPPEYIGEYKQLFSGKRFSPFTVPVSRATRALVEEIAALEETAVFNSNGHDSFKNKALLYAALSEFMRRCALIPVDATAYDVCRKAVAYITDHYLQDITLSSVAQHCGITPPHLSRVLNTQAKVSFSDIVNSLRVFEAKRLLEQTNLPISQIALDSGFGTIRNFHRTFQKYFNCHPKELRSKAQDPNAIPLFHPEPVRRG